jgi:hypothetical protein
VTSETLSYDVDASETLADEAPDSAGRAYVMCSTPRREEVVKFEELGMDVKTLITQHIFRGWFQQINWFQQRIRSRNPTDRISSL